MRFVACLLFSTLIIQACKEKVEKTTPIIKPITESVYASGIVKSLNQYQFNATVSGTIKTLYVRAGDPVKKGQALLLIENEAGRLMQANAELDARFSDYASNQARIRELSLNVDNAKTKMEFDEAQYARSKKLYDNDAGTKVDLDQKAITLRNSKTQYQAAQLQLSDLKKQIALASQKTKNVARINQAQNADFTVRSEMDGIVYDLFKEKGELVNPQVPLGIIGDRDEFKIELQIDQQDIAQVQVGQKVLFTLESNKDKVYGGRITKLIPLMNERTQTFTVEAEFTKAPPTLMPQMTLESNILLSTKDKALLIPRKFLLPGDSVQLASKKKVAVKTGLKDYQYVEIISGLKSSDEVILPKS